MVSIDSLSEYYAVVYIPAGIFSVAAIQESFARQTFSGFCLKTYL